MIQFWDHANSTRRHFFSYLATASPVRYGVVGMVFVSLLLAIGYTLPIVNRDRHLLWKVHDVDVLGVGLVGDLQGEVEAGRARFLRILLATSNTQDRDAEISLLRQDDAAVLATSNQVRRLERMPQAWQQFAAAWEQYRVVREGQMAMALQGREAEALREDDLDGRASFARVEDSVRNAKTAFDDSSRERIREVTKSMREAAVETLLLLAVTILSLGLLTWMDRQRIKAQRQLVKATEKLRASEDRFRQAYHSASVGMGIFSLDGTVLSANHMAAQILGYEVGELVGTKVSDFMAPEHREDHLELLASRPRDGSGDSYRTERRVIRKDGSAAWVRNSVTLMKPEGQEPHYFSISEEITLQKEANERLAFLVNFDPVTSLRNLHYFEQELKHSLLQSDGSSCVALLYAEIDSFDFVKGTFGRTVADEILREVAAGLNAFQREGEIVARLDDHSFGVLMRAAPYDEATLMRGSELREVFHKASESGRHGIPLSASIGVAYSTDAGSDSGSVRRSGNGADADTLLKYGRAAMLEARARGGDSIHVADPGLQERAAQRHQIESALLRGLREDEFRVVFQPQFEISTGRLVRFEALCRWHSEELGTISPDRFIPIAEQTGLIMEIGRRILHMALMQAKTWTDSGRRIGVAINISPMQFMRPDFTETITEALSLSKFPPALLELEITEGIFIRDLNVAVSRIRELQRLGLSVALDDFGTGYSSLSYLQRMPIDAVKLDRSFVRELTTDPATVSLVRSVLAMAAALNLRVVTEGVETEQQLDILRALGCDEAQGYLLGRPESPDMALRRVLESPMLPIGTMA
jgi:PAS domain S-box-containing protein/diguanylate cyclase (GGDEF)-like protein